MYRLIVVACAVVLLGTTVTGLFPVQACSGGGRGNTISQILASDIIVMGHQYVTDDNGINALLVVNEYVKGNATDQYLLMSRERPSVINFVQDYHGYPAHCAYLTPSIAAGRDFIAGLYRASNGSYSGEILTSDVDGTFTFYPDDQPDVAHHLPYQSMRSYLSDIVQQTPYAPVRHEIPRLATLQLLTAAGQSYWLPVDQDTVIPVPAEMSAAKGNR